MSEIKDSEKLTRLMEMAAELDMRVIPKRLPIRNMRYRSFQPRSYRHLEFPRFFAELKGFYDEYGHCSVSPKEEYRELYNKCRIWRIRYNKFEEVKTQNQRTKVAGEPYHESVKIMEEEEYEKLKKIGFGLSYKDAVWNKWYEKLKKFRDINHHCCVTSKDDEKKEFKGLWAWVQRQRLAYKEMKKEEPKKLEKLLEIGFFPTDSISIILKDPELVWKFFEAHKYYCNQGNKSKESHDLKRFGDTQEKGTQLRQEYAKEHELINNLIKEKSHLKALENRAKDEIERATRRIVMSQDFTDEDPRKGREQEEFRKITQELIKNLNSEIEHHKRRIKAFNDGYKHLDSEIHERIKAMEEKKRNHERMIKELMSPAELRSSNET